MSNFYCLLRAKKRFDKYGESKRAIENGAEGAEHMEYVLASAFADEVLAERRQARENSMMPRYPEQRMRQDLAESSYADIEEEETSMTEQVKRLANGERRQSATGRMAVEAENSLDKRTVEDDKAQADLMNEMRENFKIDMEKYGDGFSKKNVQIMLQDNDFQKTVAKLLENEGGYVNDKDDRGGETKYGISKKSYPNENIKKITKERAKMLYYTDYWCKFDLKGSLIKFPV